MLEEQENKDISWKTIKPGKSYETIQKQFYKKRKYEEYQKNQKTKSNTPTKNSFAPVKQDYSNKKMKYNEGQKKVEE